MNDMSIIEREDMEDSRRGFLKRAIAAGTLIVPFGTKKSEIIKDTSIIDPSVSQAEPIMDLGDCLVIPKSHIKGWSISVEGGTKYSHYHKNLLTPIITTSLEIELDSKENIPIFLRNRENKEQIILPYGTLEYP